MDRVGHDQNIIVEHLRGCNFQTLLLLHLFRLNGHVVKKLDEVFVIDHLIENADEIKGGVLLNFGKIPKEELDVFVVAGLMSFMKDCIPERFLASTWRDQLRIL